MLILTMRKGREDDESIIIGDEDVIFKLLGVKGNQVRVGILTKNPSTPINRRGIYDRIKRERENKED